MSLDTTRIRGLCFDVDGTLADTDDQFVETLAGRLRLVEQLPTWLQKSLAGSRYSDKTGTSITLARRIVMSMESPANILFGIPDKLHLDQPMLAASEWLRERTSHGNGTEAKASFKIIAGVREMLEKLHGRYPLSIVSARGARGTLGFLEQFHLSAYFNCIVTAHTCRHTKPYPDPVLLAAREMGLQPQACLMIGDTTVDIRAGRAAGAQTLGVLCGFGMEDELTACGADGIVKTTANLLAVLDI